MFAKVLIANRGEIACRVLRTARRMGIRTVAVFSEADRDALHVRCADEAIEIGPAPAKDSYLCVDRILDAARRSGAEAIHPGYGFLSESAEFAERCRQAGLVFVGPAPEAMRAVGGKAEAKQLMARIGVPTLPAYLGASQDVESFIAAARRIGFPLVVKASAGGGGRGMRVVARLEELGTAMARARREALVAFGDDRLLIEKYLDRPRHVETQFIADDFGNVRTFPERDCSLQRHHQKVIEETPAPGLSEALRLQLRDATTRIARASNYTNAGTAEFLVKDEALYFLEVNARLQVEHPVTEMVSGVDLVEWQFRVAAGEYLPVLPNGSVADGCAIEARICAEDPLHDFRPSSGVISHLSFPESSADIRIESGVKEGDKVSPFYDPLLAKVIVKGETRPDALRRLKGSLEAVALVGVATNVSFLVDLLGRSEFVLGHADTALVERLPGRQASTLEDEWLLAAAAAVWQERNADAMRRAFPNSPWAVADSWRLYGESRRRLSFRLGDRVLSCHIATRADGSLSLHWAHGTSVVSARREGKRLELCIDGLCRELTCIPDGNDVIVVDRAHNSRLEWIDPLEQPRRESDEANSLVAPLPARVTRIFVRNGDNVAKGAPILLLEAMKMEIPIDSPRDGVVEKLLCNEGQSVQEGEQLVAMAASP